MAAETMTRSIRFIGDVHGRYEQYKRIIAEVPKSVQLGDMEVGFRSILGRSGQHCYPNPPLDAMVRGDHRFIRGNHDNPGACRKHSQWIADGHFENGMMFVGGAISIDRASRIEDYTWWRDEELSADELKRMIVLYIERKPRIMVTHDCPEEVASVVLSRVPLLGSNRQDFPSRTRHAFQEMWAAHSPELWIFGHYHMSFDHVLRGGRETGTRFICLAELEFRDLEISSQ
jgi:hypothetical protein